jgi:hypothetical protein
VTKTEGTAQVIGMQSTQRVRRRRLSCVGLLTCLGVVLVLAPSCNGGSGAAVAVQQDSGSEAGSACIPGRQVACPCVGGSTGAQVCGEDGTGYGVCACADGGSVDAGGDAAPDAPRFDGSVWWSDAGTCAAVANRCSHGAANPDGGPDVLSADTSYNDCLCGGVNDPNLAQCIGLNGSNVVARCDAYCKDNNPGFEAATYCHVEGGAFGPIFHCECLNP